MKSPRYILRESIIFKIINTYAIKSFFELGYGNGELLLTLSRLGVNGYGYDFSSDAYKFAEIKLKINKVNNIHLIKDAEEIGTNTFQAILFFEVIGYFSDPITELRKLSKNLSDDGIMVFSFTNKKSQGFAEKATGDMKCYSKEEIIDILSKSNLQPIEIINYGFPLTNILKYLLNFYHYIKYIKGSRKSEKEGTEQSGLIEKDFFIKLIGIFYKKCFFLPFILIQSFFQKSNLGSGYIVVCNKVM